MKRYVLLAFNSPLNAEVETAYNHWHEAVHVPDIKAIDGINIVERYKAVNAKGIGQHYATLHDIETADIEFVLKELGDCPRDNDDIFDRDGSDFLLAELID